MNTFIDNLNLRPQEKRIIVIVGVVVFVVLDLLFVQPHFSDYGRIKRQLETTRHDIESYKARIKLDQDGPNSFVNQLNKLQREGGSNRFSGEIQLQSTIAAQARKTGVNVSVYNPVTFQRIGPTNAASQFFENQSMRITVTAKEEDLVSFLYNIGNDPAMIRVRELSLHPLDANRFQLKGEITLTADYKKKVAPKPATPAPTSTTAPKPTTATPTPTTPKPNTPKPNTPAVQPGNKPASNPATTPGGRPAANNARPARDSGGLPPFPNIPTRPTPGQRPAAAPRNP